MAGGVFPAREPTTGTRRNISSISRHESRPARSPNGLKRVKLLAMLDLHFSFAEPCAREGVGSGAYINRNGGLVHCFKYLRKKTALLVRETRRPKVRPCRR